MAEQLVQLRQCVPRHALTIRCLNNGQLDGPGLHGHGFYAGGPAAPEEQQALHGPVLHRLHHFGQLLLGEHPRERDCGPVLPRAVGDGPDCLRHRGPETVDAGP